MLLIIVISIPLPFYIYDKSEIIKPIVRYGNRENNIDAGTVGGVARAFCIYLLINKLKMIMTHNLYIFEILVLDMFVFAFENNY